MNPGRSLVEPLLAFVREMAAVECGGFSHGAPGCQCAPCRARAVLDAWEKRGPLRDEHEVTRGMESAAWLLETEVRDICDAIDRALFGDRASPAPGEGMREAGRWATGFDGSDGGHRYPRGVSGYCEFGCGCWAGPWQSRGVAGVAPLGLCPKNPIAPATKETGHDE